MRISLFLILTCSFNLSFSQKIDTLRVYQSDTLFFEKQTWVPRSCAFPFSTKPKPRAKYTLKKPIKNTYYYIYNDKKQLEEKGKCEYYEGENVLMNSKIYEYYKNDKLSLVRHRKGIQDKKWEFYNSVGNIKKIIYLEEKTGAYLKLELYRKNKLIETVVY